MTTPAIVKKADLKRMMAAVQESGYDSARIVIDPRTGKVNILLGLSVRAILKEKM